MNPIVMATLLLAGIAGMAAPAPSYAQSSSPPSAQKEQYTCPMHHQVRSDHPGECPICHMRLELVKGAPSTPKVVSKERKVKYYRNPMDPSVHSQVPAKDSMGMDYIPVYEGEGTQVPSSGNVEGRASIRLTPEQLKLSGTRTIVVERRDLVKELRVPGRALGGDRISLQIYEHDLSLVKPGQAFRADAPSLPGEKLNGQITSIESILDPMTRTARVNGTLLRSGSSLRAESSLSAVIQIRIAGALAVPETAVLHTGTKDLLYISDDETGFSPREVTLGTKAQGFYEIKDGVKAGEKVSSGPNFLLDSESRIESSYDPSNH